MPKCIGRERKPAAVTSANNNARRHMHFSNLNKSIPDASSEAEITTPGAIGKRSASHVLNEKAVSYRDSRSDKPKLFSNSLTIPEKRS